MAEIYNYHLDLDRSSLRTEIKEELRILFGKNILKPISKSRRTISNNGLQTQRLRSLNIIAMLDLLDREGGFKLVKVERLRQKHIDFLVKYWVGKGLSRGTIENKLSYLGALLVWINKSGLKCTALQVAEVKKLPTRTWITEKDKTWESANIDIGEIITRISGDEPNVGLQLLLQLHFGLRSQEAMLLRPAKAELKINDHSYLEVVHGTKGGRPRKVLIETDEQSKLLTEARLYTNSKTGSLIPDGYSLKQWIGRYFTLLRKYDITKKKLGVTGHGLRAQYFTGIYKQITGMETPVRNGAKPDMDVLKKARQTIVERAGHSTPYKSHAYIGSHTAVKRKFTQSITDTQIVAALKDCNNNRTHAAEKLGLSRAMLYRRMANIPEVEKMSASQIC
jgi:hypothetical protein